MSLTPTSTMPYGKFKGIQMQDVPPEYILWLSEQPFSDKKYPDIIEYVKINKDKLSKQLPHQEFMSSPMKSEIDLRNFSKSLKIT